MEFSKDFHGFKKIDIELPIELIEKIKRISEREEYSKLGFDGTLVSLLGCVLENENYQKRRETTQ